MYLTYEDIQKKKKRQILLLKLLIPVIAVLIGLLTAYLGAKI